jgi:hypothetical protein
METTFHRVSAVRVEEVTTACTSFYRSMFITAEGQEHEVSMFANDRSALLLPGENGHTQRMRKALEDALDFLAEQEDADCDGERFVPNRAMSLAMRLREALGEKA